MSQSQTGEWDTAYEWKVVLLMSLGFGLVGIDRFLIAPLAPVMMKDLDLDYQDIGLITGALAIAWGFSSIFAGGLSDRFGFRRMIVPSMIGFSFAAAASGFAGGLMSLIVMRSLMGLAEGAYTPASLMANITASKPSRRGRNIGLQQTMPALFGLGVAPIVVTQLLEVMDWHLIFPLVGAPGLVVAWFAFKILRDGSGTPAPLAEAAPAAPAADEAEAQRWHHVFRHRNISLCVIGMLCWITVLVVLTALLPSYLTEHLGLSLQQMGFVLSAVGFGGVIGAVTMPSLSDVIGRRPVAVISAAGALIALYLLANCGPEPWKLFTYLLVCLCFIFSLITLNVGPITAESVPAGLITTASGLVIGIGEIFGGGAAPMIAGYVAQRFGLEYCFHLPIAALAIGVIAMALLKETKSAAGGETLVPALRYH